MGKIINFKNPFIYVFTLLFIFIIFICPGTRAQENIIKIGTYPNEPVVFRNKQGKMEGLFIDIIEHIAQKEGWNIKYIHNSWDEGLKMLKNNELDLMTGIAYTKDRDKIYDYPKNSFITTWGQIYTREGDDILSILDLEDKVVGVLKNDIYYIGNVGLKKMAEKFNVNCEFLELTNYEQILVEINNQTIDAGLMPRLYGVKKAVKYNAKQCPVVINPIELTVAVPEKNNLYLLNTIDKHLSQLKNDKNSYYYQRIEHWTTINENPEMPAALKAGLLIIYLIFILFIFNFIIIRKQVQNKTRQLKEKERLLQNNKNKITELHQVAIKMEQSKTVKEIYQLTVNAAEKLLAFDLCVLKIYEKNVLKTVAYSSSFYSKDSQTKIPENDSNISSIYHSNFTFPIEDIGVMQIFSSNSRKLSEEEKELAQLIISHTISALQRLQANEKIRYISFHDRLTNLYNRDYLEEELNRLNSERQLPLSIIMGDVNGLKLINDTLGHQKGDKLLQKIANSLKKSTRAEDIIGRWGGDEFLMILPRTNYNNAKKILHRVNKECENSKWEIPISIALGIGVKNEEFEHIAGVIKEADNNMYKDKINKKEIYKTKMINTIHKKLENKQCNEPEYLQRLKKLLCLLQEK